MHNLKGGLERVRGIEPPYSAWEADVLPLNYTRVRQENNGISAPGQGDPCKVLALQHRRLVGPSLLWEDGVQRYWFDTL
jgi:hypothetical protein